MRNEEPVFSKTDVAGAGLLAMGCAAIIKAVGGCVSFLVLISICALIAYVIGQ